MRVKFFELRDDFGCRFRRIYCWINRINAAAERSLRKTRQPTVYLLLDKRRPRAAASPFHAPAKTFVHDCPVKKQS